MMEILPVGDVRPTSHLTIEKHFLSSALGLARAPTDWVGLWYRLGREVGTNDVCTLTRVHPGNGRIEYFDFSHEDMDGAAALTRILRSEGWSLTVPLSERGRRPGLRDRLRLAAEFLPKLFEEKSVEWRHFDARARNPADRHAFPFLLMSEAKTRGLKKAARDQGLSLNALILAKVNEMIAREFATPEGQGRWLFPVNMRGLIRRKNDLANLSSAILLDVTAAAAPASIDKQMRRGLKSLAYWPIWWMLHVGKLIGVSGMRRMLRSRNAVNSQMGTYSHMGAWPGPHALAPQAGSEDRDAFWVCTPPGTPLYPVSVGLLEWHGKLSLSLKIHPALDASQTRVWDLARELQGSFDSISDLGASAPLPQDTLR